MLGEPGVLRNDLGRVRGVLVWGRGREGGAPTGECGQGRIHHRRCCHEKLGRVRTEVFANSCLRDQKVGLEVIEDLDGGRLAQLVHLVGKMVCQRCFSRGTFCVRLTSL